MSGDPDVVACLPGGAWIRRLDARLLAVSAPVRGLVVAITIAAIVWQSLPYVPRDVADLSRVPGVTRQQASFGTDTIADAYEARVVLNDLRDMYTKRLVDQTPIEARTWSKEASSPYPPAVLLANAGLFALAGRTTAGFYLMVLALAVAFLALSLAYFLRTRWFFFPLLYLNFGLLGYRFAGVQDGSYLLMLVVLAAAMLLARARRPLAHLLVAVAITLKLSPLFYALEAFRMSRRTAAIFAALVVAGLVLPYFVWDNYLYIYSYGAELKGNPSSRAWSIVALGVFGVAIAYVETRLQFDMEERIGWGLVPFAIFFAIRMNVARHLLLVLLVPDKRGWRNLSAAAGYGVYALSMGTMPLGNVLSIVTGLLVLALAAHLHAIGRGRILADLRQPRAVLRAWASPAGTPARVP